MQEAKTIRIKDKMDKLQERGRLLIKDQGKQIALFVKGDDVYACNNRCPHEGYPLIEGVWGGQENVDPEVVEKDCLLTCSWHNWKFDLRDGSNIYDGDNLRVYPVQIDGADIIIDITDPDPDIIIQAALKNLRACFSRHEYDRMAREIARLDKVGAPLDLAVKEAILWVNDHFEFGMQHSHAVVVDWLAQFDQHIANGDKVKALVAIVEAVAYLAWDTMREPVFPYAEAADQYDASVLQDALALEKEAETSAQIRAAFKAGLGFKDIEPILVEAVFTHYRDFGHSAIYLDKTKALIERFGKDVEEALTLCYTRTLVYSWREDDIPEFKDYNPTLEDWANAGSEDLDANSFVGLSVRAALSRTHTSGQRPPMEIYNALFQGLSWNMLHFETSYGQRSDLAVTHNTTWLSFSHGLTFANAVRKLCEAYSRYWPQGLLQMACFLGRNKAYTDTSLSSEEWYVKDHDAFFAERFDALHDHGIMEYIVAAHLMKTLTAVQEEIDAQSDAYWVPTALAAMNRFLNSSFKGKHVLRSAKQALSLVGAED